MSYRQELEGNVLVVSVLGESSFEVTSEFFETVLNRCNREGLGLVLDFTRMDFLSSSLMGQILALKSGVEQANLPMGLVNPNAMMRRYLEITGLAVHFRVFENAPEAVAGISAMMK
jgi:anti-anti-sigma factor